MVSNWAFNDFSHNTNFLFYWIVRFEDIKQKGNKLSHFIHRSCFEYLFTIKMIKRRKIIFNTFHFFNNDLFIFLSLKSSNKYYFIIFVYEDDIHQLK